MHRSAAASRGGYAGSMDRSPAGDAPLAYEAATELTSIVERDVRIAAAVLVAALAGAAALADSGHATPQPVATRDSQATTVLTSGGAPAVTVPSRGSRGSTTSGGS